MKTSYSCTVLCGAMAAALLFAASVATAQPPGGDPFYNRAEVNECWSCHDNPFVPQGWDHMEYAAETWLQSGHANSWTQTNANTYCSQCHAPVQGDPAATPDNNAPVKIADSMAVTCSSCHFDHTTASFLGTRTGNLVVGSLWWDPDKVDPDTGEPDPGLVGIPNQVVDPDTGEVLHEYEGEWDPLFFEGDNFDLLCEKCHNDDGPHLGKKEIIWEMKEHGVQCVDCHMPKVPLVQVALGDPGDPGADPPVPPVDPPVRMTRMHDFGFPLADADALAFKATFSCGTEGVGCHADESTEWAVGVIRSGAIHSPVMTVEQILLFIDTAVFEDGTLDGTGGANAGLNLWIMRYLLVNANLLLEQGNPEEAFWWLVFAYAGSDGESIFLEDLVTGPATGELNGMILQAIADLPVGLGAG